jgi:hypothetical protein
VCTRLTLPIVHTEQATRNTFSVSFTHIALSRCPVAGSSLSPSLAAPFPPPPPPSPRPLPRSPPRPRSCVVYRGEQYSSHLNILRAVSRVAIRMLRRCCRKS